MKKITSFVFALLVLFACAGTLFAINDSTDTLYTGTKTFDTGGILNVLGALKLDAVEVTASAAELNTMDGITATAEEINTAADPSAGSVSTSVTNGAVLTLDPSTPRIYLTGIGGANDTTNTITIATPYPVGITYTLSVSAASSNLITIADATTVLALGSDWLGDGTDTLMIDTVSTNEAVKLSNSDN